MENELLLLLLKNKKKIHVIAYALAHIIKNMNEWIFT